MGVTTTATNSRFVDRGAITHRRRAAHACQFFVSVFCLVWFAGCPDGGSDDDAGTGFDECTSFCELESSCDLRSDNACRQESCIGDARKANSSDACIAEAGDCAEVALCTCDEACARVELCTGSPDAACVSTCETLMGQTPAPKYRENRCIIESECDEISLCGTQ